MSTRSDIGNARRWVIKFGSSLLTADGRGLDREAISSWVAQIVSLQQRGIEVVLVSSGAIAEGMARLGWTVRPREIFKLQAAAATGQMGLVQTWEAAFQQFDRHTAQVLLVHEDLSDRHRYLNARKTLRSLLALNVVPVINENDTVVTDEIRFGDNDSLAGLVANLIEAELLVILTDQDGVYDRDPREHPEASLITEGVAGDSSLESMAGGSAGRFGRGGMRTKLLAARLAARSGSNTVIANGRTEQVLTRLSEGDEIGSFLAAGAAPIAARKQWLAGQLQTRGKLVLDDGAVRVLREAGRSLLPVGVVSVSGEFTRGDVVACVDANGEEVARGLVNYPSGEAARLAGQPSQRILEILGYLEEEELIHRDNLVLL